jgi:hypothetical protein
VLVKLELLNKRLLLVGNVKRLVELYSKRGVVFIDCFIVLAVHNGKRFVVICFRRQTECMDAKCDKKARPHSRFCSDACGKR